jgi:UDP-N-acetyl-D-mannosaminuronate dehydrogenase
VKIGYCGLGKLGFPVALATEAAGHNVFGYDPHVDIKSFLKNKEIPYQEKGVPELLKSRTSLSSCLCRHRMTPTMRELRLPLMR